MYYKISNQIANNHKNKYSQFYADNNVLPSEKGHKGNFHSWAQHAEHAAILNFIYWYQIKVTLLCQIRWCQDNNECQGREVMPANPNEESQSSMFSISEIGTQNSMETIWNTIIQSTLLQ